MLYFGLSCGSEALPAAPRVGHQVQKTDSVGCCKIAISLIDPVGSFSMREIVFSPIRWENVDLSSIKDLNCCGRKEALMQRSSFGVLGLVLALTSIGFTQTTDEKDIDRLFQDFKQALVKRSSPDALLTPSLTVQQRHKEIEKTVRPYLNVNFKYNVGDLRRTSFNEAELPLIVEWETVHGSGSMTDSADLVRVDGRWYFSNFDFMTISWTLITIIVVMCTGAVAFAAFVLYLYYHIRKRGRQQVAA
jgi:hypothetical protein